MNPQRWVDSLRQDSRICLRLMRRSPIFFGAAILTLALGIGANGAVFSILQSVLLQPLPYEDESQLVMLWHADRRELANTPADRWHDRMAFSGPMVLSVRDAAARHLGEVAAGILMRSGGQLGAVQGDALESALDLSIGDRTIRLSGASVTPNFFRVLGVHAAMGRVFSDRDDGMSESPIILSDATWRRDFGADPHIVGRSITVAFGVPRESRIFTVVGVLPRGVHFTYPDEVEAWLVMPWTAIEQSNPYRSRFTVIARLRSGLSTDQGQRLIASMPLSPGSVPTDVPGAYDRIGLTSMRDWIVGNTRPTFYLLGGVATLLLLVTCVTVASGLLARISERHQELAVRAALGATRSRVMQQLLVEGTFLALGGAVAGTLLAILTQPVLRTLLPSSLPQVGELSVNASIIAFAAVMAALTTVLAAVAPAWGGTRQDAAASLMRGASGATASRAAVRWRHALVSALASLTTVLLIFSSLLLMSLWRLGRVPLGFDPHGVLAIDLQLLDMKYVAPGAMAAFQEELLRGVRGIPGIEAAGLTSAVPFRGFDSPAQIRIPDSDRREMVRVRYVDSAYFAALRVPLLSGRLLSIDDRTGSAAVAVISESFARSAFGTASPVGEMIRLDRPTQIIGVVGDLRYDGLHQEPSSAVYVPRLQHPRPLFTLVVRLGPSMAREEAINRIRSVLHDLDPRLPALNIATMDQVVDATMAGRRFYSIAAGTFAVVALTLTCIGLTLVVARAVAERRRELAVRSALGASLTQLARVAVGEAVMAITLGVVAGLFVAGVGSVLITQFLFNVATRSPAAYGGAALMVLSIAGGAAWLPMRRFADVPLAQMLRQD